MRILKSKIDFRIKRIIKEFMRLNENRIKKGSYLFLFNKKKKILLDTKFEKKL